MAELTDKQTAFVAAYLGDARFNGAEAARIAGYSQARQSASENLSNPDIRAEINKHLESIRAEGIGNKAVRLAELNELNDSLKFIQNTRAQEAKDRYEQGEDVPEGAESGLMVEVTKQVGTGNNAVITKEWQIDKTLIDGRTKVLEQAAKEVGDRDKKIELSGPNGGPLEVASAKSKFLELIDADEPES